MFKVSSNTLDEDAEFVQRQQEGHWMHKSMSNFFESNYIDPRWGPRICWNLTLKH